MTEKETQKILGAFPSNLQEDVENVISFLSDKKFEIHPSLFHNVILNNESLTIPGRLYFDESICMGNDLSDLQKIILDCLYLLNHNGYTRQKGLENLKNVDEYFITPFVIQILGEYVVEILEVLEKQLNEKTIVNFQTFKNENPILFQKTEKRIVSYWNEYYRNRYPKLKNYIGMKILAKIKST